LFPVILKHHLYFAGVCTDGRLGIFDQNNTDIFSLDVSGVDDDNTLLDDSPVSLKPNATITITPSQTISPEFIPMDIALIVENVTYVTFKFYDENGTVVNEKRVSQLFLANSLKTGL